VGLLTKTRLRKKPDPIPSEKEKYSEGAEEVARRQGRVVDRGVRSQEQRGGREGGGNTPEAGEKEAKKMEEGKGRRRHANDLESQHSTFNDQPAHGIKPGYQLDGVTEMISMPKRTEAPESRKSCVGCGRHQVEKEKNTRTGQKQKEKESRPDKSPQPSGNGSVFP